MGRRFEHWCARFVRNDISKECDPSLDLFQNIQLKFQILDAFLLHKYSRYECCHMGILLTKFFRELDTSPLLGQAQASRKLYFFLAEKIRANGNCNCLELIDPVSFCNFTMNS